MCLARGTRRLSPILLALALALPTAADPEPTDTTGTPTPTGDAVDADGADADAPLPPPPLITIDEVNVTASRSERTALETPGNVTVIERETIEKSGAVDVPDLLRREAGVFVTNTTTNPEGYTVELRGFNNGGGNGSGTLVLVDGRRVNEPGLTNPDWSYIHLNNVERIEVVRGPVSAVYGDNAIGGVIHIITRQPEGPAMIEARGATGTYDTDAGSAFARGTLGPLSLSVFGDDWKTHGYRERSDFRERHGDVKAHLSMGEHGVAGIHAGYSSDTRQRPGTLSRLEMHLNRRQAEPGSSPKNFERSRERYVNAFTDFTLPYGITLKLQGFHRRQNEGGTIGSPAFTFLSDSENDSLGASGHVQWDAEILGHANRLIVGMDWLQEDRDTTSVFTLFPSPFGPGSTAPSSDSSRRKFGGVFIQNELNLTENLRLTLGARRESVRIRSFVRSFNLLGNRAPLFDQRLYRKYREWAPKAALTWRIADPVAVYFSYAKGFRFPNIDEAFGFFGFSPNLLPQTSRSYEAGVKLRSRYLSANVAAYTMNVRNEIFFNAQAPNALIPTITGVNVNLDRVRHRGIEFHASLTPTEWLEIYGSYTYDDVKITRDKTTNFEGFKMPITPRHRGNAGVRVQLPWWIDFSVNANFVGRRFVANDSANRFEVLPKYAVYDTQVAFRPQIGEHVRLELFVKVLNLFNRRYTEFGGQRTFFPFDVRFFPSPDRHYLVGAMVTLTR